MNIDRTRQLLKPLYYKYFGALMAEKTKAKLRLKVTGAPITPRYPYDIELKFLRSICNKPSVMLDIGANTGIYSSVLEDIVGHDNLYIFEPLPHLHKFLKQHFRKAHLFECALSDNEGKKHIRIPIINGKRIDTRATFNMHTEPNQTGFDEVEVQFNSLDNIVSKIPLNSIDFIKIDVEGHEFEVLKGGIETIARFKPLILIEIESRHHKFPITKIFCELEKIGYSGHYMNPETFELLETAEFNCDRDQNQEHLKSRNFIRYMNNFFFVHEDSRDDFVKKGVAFLKSEKQRADTLAAAGN
jgi:FkbM family methyltransferase